MALIGRLFAILFGSWRLGEFAALSDPEVQPLVIIGMVVAGPILLTVLVCLMWLPSASRSFQFGSSVPSVSTSEAATQAQI